MIYDVTEGTTQPLVFTLKYTDATGEHLLDTAGLTITYLLTSHAGLVVDTAGDLAPLAPSTSGQVQYTPDAGDFVAANGPYTSKFKVVDGNGSIDFYPRGPADTCRIFKA
jgi:hypothetical protein